MTDDAEAARSLAHRINEAVQQLLAMAEGAALVTGTVQRSDGPRRFALARALYAERRLRDRRLEPGVQSEAMWDILLDLYASGGEGRQVSVSSACLAACVPSTTALRHIARLVAQGLIERHAAPTDARRTFLTLTDQGQSTMDQYLSLIIQLRSGSRVIVE